MTIEEKSGEEAEPGFPPGGEAATPDELPCGRTPTPRRFVGALSSILLHGLLLGLALGLLQPMQPAELGPIKIELTSLGVSGDVAGNGIAPGVGSHDPAEQQEAGQEVPPFPEADSGESSAGQPAIPVQQAQPDEMPNSAMAPDVLNSPDGPEVMDAGERSLPEEDKVTDSLSASKATPPSPAEVSAQKREAAARGKEPQSENAPRQKRESRAPGAGGEPARTQDLIDAAATQKSGAGQGEVAATPPQVKIEPRPEYPALARKRGQEGTVLVRCRVSTQGIVSGVELERSSGFRLLDEAALKAVSQWTFLPAMEAGKPVESAIVVPVQFRLE